MRYLPLIVACVFPAVCLAESGGAPSPAATAAQVDQLILSAEQTGELQMVDEATFLRRVMLDLTGRPASTGMVTRFGLDPSEDKRQRIVDELLDSPEYGKNWSRYWRDAILLRATNMRVRIVQPAFEQWMADSLNENLSWVDIVTDLLTATGNVAETGATALLFAHEGVPEEVAAEASRLFMGIQVQCANCHDHPWDRWKREEFHEFVAFFPRVGVRRDRNSDNRQDWVVASMDREQRRRPGVSAFLLKRLDRNRDQIISEQEARRSLLQRLFSNERITERIDKNGDGRLSIEEIKSAQPAGNNRPGQGSAEHYMPDLDNPASEGTRVDPVFFVNDRKIRSGASDLDRRGAAARLITGRGNKWFARAIVNRLWAELTGTAFYAPVDDMGPDREAQHEAALDVLCDGFVASGYELKWLFRTIVSTSLYQRDIKTDVDGFARMEPVRLRSDQLYDSLCQSLGVESLTLSPPSRPGGGGYGRLGDRSRQAIAATFGFDPSTPRDDVTGSIPQTLFLMNSPLINRLISADDRQSPIARIMQRVSGDDNVVRELYLSVLGREVEDGELSICRDYVAESGRDTEAFEDILWTLLNSSEFVSRR